MVIIPEEEWNAFKDKQEQILESLKGLQNASPGGQGLNRSPHAPLSNYITAKEFMDAVRIRRTKFDELVQSNQVRILKKGRKIYVEVKEIQRYFSV